MLEVTNHRRRRKPIQKHKINTRVIKCLASCFTMSSLLIFNHPVVGNTTLLYQVAQQIQYVRITTELQKHINNNCCSLNKISTKENSRARKFWSNDKFWFFWPNNFWVDRDITVKFGLWMFHKKQYIFDFTDFWLPYSWGKIDMACLIWTPRKISEFHQESEFMFSNASELQQ